LGGKGKKEEKAAEEGGRSKEGVEKVKEKTR